MNKLLCLAVALVASLTVSAQQLPDVKVENEAGKVISTRSLVGKPMIISYWSLACKPCIQELNAMNDALEEWREEADFEVVAVSVDDVRLKARAKAKATSMGWDFICLFDANQAMKRAMNVSLTPQSFVVDAEGNIVFSHSGYTPGSEQLLFEKLLETIKK
ncbi:MAG: TlpA family protein disulfide reductase [Rikenellaceae bacterium]|nr:TlpA family protein disulfide reductase [Rikenellaceae bacterium]